MKKIGLIGYFNAGAFSDDIIEYTTKQVLRKIDPHVEFDSDLLRRCVGGTDPDYLNGLDLIIHAGGSLLGKCTHYPVRDIQSWYEKVETPLAIFGAGYRYEPDKEPLNEERRTRLQLLLDKAEVISVRGHRTLHHLKENDVDTSRVQSLGDPVMACDLNLRLEPKYVMGNVRNMPNVEIQHATTERVQELMAEIYDWLINHYKLPLVLVSFRHNIGSDNDMKGALKTQAKMKNNAKIIAPKNFSDALLLMRNAVFWLGQRLHPTIFASTQGIPFVGVEYQFDKMLDWISTVGIDNYVHTRVATLESFLKAYEKVPRNMEKLKRVLPVRKKEIYEVAEKIIGLM